MALVLADRVKETSSTPGTGALTLGGAESGFQTFSAAIGDGSTTYYTIQDTNGNWEVGEGTYTASSNSLSRDTVFDSSNSGNLVDFGANAKEVFVTLPASKVGGGGGSGTVTTVSVVSANGFAGTVADATTTPAITLSTSITGLLKGNGTAISAASAGVDYVAVNGALGTPISGNFSTGTFTWPTFNQNTTGTAAGLSSTLAIASGGTGLTTVPANGQLLIGNGTNYSLANLTAGTGISISNGSGSITVTNSAPDQTVSLTAGSNVTITGTYPNFTIAASGGGSSLLGQTDSATPFETSLGYEAGKVNTAVDGTFIGYQAGLANSTGTDNSFVGFSSGKANTTGQRNTAIGSYSLASNSTTYSNTAIGYGALYANIASNNTAVGANSLQSLNNAGASANVAIGQGSGYSATNTSNSTFLGASAGYTTSTGYNSTFVGYQAGYSTTTGYENTYLGMNAGYSNAANLRNTSVGTDSLYNATASYNTALGYRAGYRVSTGASNVIIGREAGSSGTNDLTTGSNNILIGNLASASSATVSNEATWGNSSITSNRFWGDLKPGGSSAGTAGQVLTSQGAGVSPTWTTVSGGGGLTNWTEAVTTSAPNATVPAVSFTATNAATNVDAVIRPKGTGALLAAIPDNTSTGGNKRGANAVDLQMARSAATQIAKGTYSGVLSGERNSAIGNYTAVAGGSANSASGNYSGISGGQSNTTNYSYSFIGNGYQNQSSGSYSAIICGENNQTNTDYSTVIGSYGYSRQGIGSITFAPCKNIYSGGTGTVQSSMLIVGKETYDTTPEVCVSDDSGYPSPYNQLVVDYSTVYSVRGTAVAYCSTTFDAKEWTFTALIKNVGGTVSLVGTPTVTSTFSDAGASGWSLSIAANTSLNSLEVTVVGDSANTTRFACKFETVEVLIY